MFSLAFFSSKRRVDRDVASVVVRIFVSSSNGIVSIFFQERGQVGRWTMQKRFRSCSRASMRIVCGIFARRDGIERKP